MSKVIKVFCVLGSLLALFGCETADHYDYSELIASKPRSILVLPPLNHSVEVNAPYTFLSTITKPLAEKGYYVFPVAVIDAYMKENGLPTELEMNQVPLEKLREQFGADSVLYVEIDSWGQQYQVISSKAEVRARLKLVDARSGKQLWSATAYAAKDSGNNNGGLAGALIGALITQVAGSLSDSTPGLSASANFNAVYNRASGLLYGPYAPSGAEPFEPTAQ